VKENAKGAKNKRKKSDEDPGLLPDIRGELHRFSSIITWKVVGKKKIPEPKEGLDEEFDKSKLRIEEVKANLNDYLDEV